MYMTGKPLEKVYRTAKTENS